MLEKFPANVLNASKTRESTKCPWVGVVTPPPLPKGILFSPQFRSHQETKMTARSNWKIDINDLTEK